MKINNLSSLLFGISCLFLITQPLVAQRAIEGFVYNDNNTPIYRATVQIKATEVTTRTDENGYFKLEDVPEEAKLIFSYLDFKVLEVEPFENAQVVVRLGATASSPIKGVETNRIDYTKDYGDEIFTTVEQQPEFIGGISEMYKYLGSKIVYPEKAVKGKQEGKVFVRFVVEKDGSIGAVELLKGIGLGCDEEAIRVVSEMPKWKPGMQNGQPIRVYYTMPINFRLE